MKSLIDKIRGESYITANSIIRGICGIVNYFSSDDEKYSFISEHESLTVYASEDRASYGDWQTPPELAKTICKQHSSKYGNPDIVIEPTCGVGAFVIAALEIYPELSELHAIEINPQYTATLKYKILSQSVIYGFRKHHPDIYIHTQNFFCFDFKNLLDKCAKNDWRVAVLGNLPWVTNSRQGKFNSTNLPNKNNLHNLKGIDAITGKSNFDISEYMTLHLLRLAGKCDGGISLLLKNSVIRNIVSKQRSHPLHMGEIEQLQIDASKEFNVSVDASCLTAKLNCEPSTTCKVINFYQNSLSHTYGWVYDRFISDTETYSEFSRFDNKSAYVWRSGIKHDCTSALELELKDGHLTNGYGEMVTIEEDFIYPLIKSSDVKKFNGTAYRKYVIVPQKKTGEDTSWIKQSAPLTYAYLEAHKTDFSRRKSVIYKGKDQYSIFGVGDYSFKPYKIIVSALYKDIRFTLVSEHNGKPVMIDDTCYQLDFNTLDEATIIYKALTSHEIQSLLRSIIFLDAKRVVTKELLMRLDLVKYCQEKGLILNSCVGKNAKQPSLFN
ncbi:MAG: SAM-dependent methyltransferase [Bacteroides sp.]|nr:SAM-dependent methyltransferase [Bacteroides sp.]MCM1390482.1 SAM-dependent methyltransferase [Bacteroides sp.]